MPASCPLENYNRFRLHVDVLRMVSESILNILASLFTDRQLKQITFVKALQTESFSMNLDGPTVRNEANSLTVFLISIDYRTAADRPFVPAETFSMFILYYLDVDF